MMPEKAKPRASRWMADRFERISDTTARWCASHFAFSSAALLVLVWLGLGPHYGWSDSYNMVINTVTTIVTFLMGFLILASNHRSEAAIQLKLDVIIKHSEASNEYMAAERLTAGELAEQAQHLRGDPA